VYLVMYRDYLLSVKSDYLISTFSYWCYSVSSLVQSYVESCLGHLILMV